MVAAVQGDGSAAPLAKTPLPQLRCGVVAHVAVQAAAASLPGSTSAVVAVIGVGASRFFFFCADG